MCENLYYTITDYTIIDQDAFDITDIVADAKNKIIEDEELEDHELEEKLTNYSYMTLKQLIGETLDKVLNINILQHKSPYTYEVYIVNTKRV